MDPTSAIATGGGGGKKGPYPPNGRLFPRFGLLKILLLKHHATTRQQTTMEKGIITFKHNFPLMFFRFFAKLLATNCCTLIWRNFPSHWHAFTDVSRKRHVSMQNSYRYFVSDYDMKQCVKTFFKDQLFWFFRAHSTFWGRSQWKPHLQSHLKNWISKYDCLNVFLDLTRGGHK